MKDEGRFDGISVGRKLGLVALVIGVGFVASTVFHYFMATAMGKGYPYSTFLFNPNDQFNDYNNMIHIVEHNNPYDSGFAFNSNYFPFANWFFMAFASIGRIKVSLVLFLGMFVGLYGLLIHRLVRFIPGVTLLGLFCVFFMNYPLWFAIDRANLELYLFLLVAGFFYFYFVEHRPFLAIVFLALATAMKLYPGVFVVFLLRDKKFRELALFAVVVVAATLVPMLTFVGGLEKNVPALAKALGDFSSTYSSEAGIQHNLSLLGALVVCNFLLSGLFSGTLATSIDPFLLSNELRLVYSLLVVAIFIWLAVRIWRRKLSNADSALGLTIALLIFPPVSFDYKLLLLLIPLWMMILDGRCSRRRDFVRLVALGIVLVPKDYLMILGDVSIAVLVNSLTLLVLFIDVLLKPSSSLLVPDGIAGKSSAPVPEDERSR